MLLFATTGTLSSLEAFGPTTLSFREDPDNTHGVWRRKGGFEFALEDVEGRHENFWRLGLVLSF